jgi:hypothetical protein
MKQQSKENRKHRMMATEAKPTNGNKVERKTSNVEIRKCVDGKFKGMPMHRCFAFLLLIPNPFGTTITQEIGRRHMFPTVQMIARTFSQSPQVLQWEKK